MQKLKKQQRERSRTSLLRLSDDASLKHLEEYYLYNKSTDELYEIDEKACDFLRSCDGSNVHIIPDEDFEFIDFCLEEGIVKELNSPAVKKNIAVHANPAAPSLRYLELLITDKCNLSCRHCYIKQTGNTDLSLDAIKKTFSEFESLGGVRLMVSGGEPLLHKSFGEINDLVWQYDFRSILITNGTLINKFIVDNLNFNEVQISLDGLEKTHDYIRGEGSFVGALNAISLLLGRGIDVSVATMILNHNQDDLEKLGRLLSVMGVKRWEVDVPCATSDDEIFMGYERAGKSFKHGFSSGLYNSADGYACGAHLMTVMNNGNVTKCSFFADDYVGSLDDGLSNCFGKLRKIKLTELECDCDYIEECRGGCRYRAMLGGGIKKKDIAKCGFYLDNK